MMFYDLEPQAGEYIATFAERLLRWANSHPVGRDVERFGYPSARAMFNGTPMEANRGESLHIILDRYEANRKHIQRAMQLADL